MGATVDPGMSAHDSMDTTMDPRTSGHNGMDGKIDLLVVGAGAKATALAAKIHALNTLGAGPFALTIVEATELAASWLGRNGMTSGEEPLAIPPIKDIGFPYQSSNAFGELGAELDRAMMPFTWQQYMIGKGEYARWVNAGSPAVQHRDYGRYLTWVLSQATAGVTIVRGRVTQVSLPEQGERWRVEVLAPASKRRYECDALVLTGPGVHRALPHDPDAAARIFHCDSRRGELARIPLEQSCDIAIVGGGESALSCGRLPARLPPGGEDDRVHADAAAEPRRELPGEPRLLQPRRGRLERPRPADAPRLRQALRPWRVRPGDAGEHRLRRPLPLRHRPRDARRLAHRARSGDGEGGGVYVDYAGAEGLTSARHDYLINCTGFDLLEQLRGLFSPALRAEIERQAGPVWERPPEAEVAIGRALELQGMRPRLYIPGLAALSQGPGFANLGCLGLLANRVLAPLVLGSGELRQLTTRHALTRGGRPAISSRASGLVSIARISIEIVAPSSVGDTAPGSVSSSIPRPRPSASITLANCCVGARGRLQAGVGGAGGGKAGERGAQLRQRRGEAQPHRLVALGLGPQLDEQAEAVGLLARRPSIQRSLPASGRSQVTRSRSNSSSCSATCPARCSSTRAAAGSPCCRSARRRRPW